MFYSRSVRIAVDLHVEERGITNHCKKIMSILGDAHCADGMRKLMQKLSRVANRVDLPDLRFVDQSHEDFAVGSNSNVLNPLSWAGIMVSYCCFMFHCRRR